MELWLDGFTRIVGEGSGTWAPDDEDAPKIVLHTTEGSRIQAALDAYRQNNSWPHLTVDPTTRTRWQHVPLDTPARALRNTSTPGQTNREGRVYQVEILGFAGRSHLWDGDTLDWLGTDVVGPLARATGTPLQSTVEFFGEGAGWVLASASARQRLSAKAWDTYTGILGHQHVPENTHWDPGAIDIDRILAAARNLTSPPPDQEDIMATLDDLAELLDTKLAGIRSNTLAELGQAGTVLIRDDRKTGSQVWATNGIERRPVADRGEAQALERILGLPKAYPNYPVVAWAHVQRLRPVVAA